MYYATGAMAGDDRYLLRTDFERAVRRLEAQVAALTDELNNRLPLTENAASVEAEVDAAVADVHAWEVGSSRVALDEGPDKYTAEVIDIPCAELIPLCQGRCCSFKFALSTQDLDEGVIRFDYGQPYMIRQRPSDGYCVHSDPTTRACDAHASRPRTCRTYDCRSDERVWIDYDKRIPAPRERPLERDPIKIERDERARPRGLAVWREGNKP